MYYLQSRYYDPAVGRFINADGYVSTGQGYVGYNAFAYCLNNPVVCKDESGDEAVVALTIVGAALLGGIGGMATAALTHDSLLVGFTVGAGTGVATLFTGFWGGVAVAAAGDIVAQRMEVGRCLLKTL